MYKEITESFKVLITRLLCDHRYVCVDICTKDLHSKMVCSKCGKTKHIFEG